MPALPTQPSGSSGEPELWPAPDPPAPPPGARADSQLDALLAVRTHIDRDGVLTDWTRANGASGRYCLWQGVVCAGAPGSNGSSSPPVVEGVLLDATSSHVRRLRGMLPPAAALSGLPHLARIVISDQGRGITGSLPADWAGLPRLAFLRLKDNALTGTLPEAWARLPLRRLWLYKNQLRGTLPAAYSRLAPTIEDFQVGGNQFESTLPAAWAAWTRVKELWVIKMPGIRGSLPPEWQGMRSLEVLRLWSTSLSGSLPRAWAGLGPQLRVLALKRNRLSGPLPAEWSSLTGMAELALGANALTGRVPSSWAGMAQLSSLALHNNSIAGPLPEALASQRSGSDVRGTRITGWCKDE